MYPHSHPFQAFARLGHEVYVWIILGVTRSYEKRNMDLRVMAGIRKNGSHDDEKKAEMVGTPG